MLDPDCDYYGGGGGGGGSGGGGAPGGVDGSITEAGGLECCQPPDPSPGADGIWIGWEGRDCYLNYSTRIGQDSDGDWIDDECEYQLARAFAPMLSMDPSDACPKGEPYWAVRYFDDRWGLGWGQFVRIAYMPAYYRDCGNSYAHVGDAEFLMVQLGFDSKTRHWVMVRMYFSAHANDNDLNINNNSDFRNYDELEYPSRIYRSYPRVFVAVKKHANYYTRQRCNTAGILNFDDCTYNVDRGRIRVLRSHNIGGYDHQTVNCVSSQNALYYQNGVQECFWQGKDAFRGWQSNGALGGAVYSWYLMSGVYECFLYNGLFDCYYGP